MEKLTFNSFILGYLKCKNNTCTWNWWSSAPLYDDDDDEDDDDDD